MRIIVIHIDRGCLEEKGSRCWKKKDIGIAVASNIHLQFVQPVHYVKKFSIFCEVIEICCFIFVITIFL
jgi:hypothetical protein